MLVPILPHPRLPASFQWVMRATFHPFPPSAMPINLREKLIPLLWFSEPSTQAPPSLLVFFNSELCLNGLSASCASHGEHLQASKVTSNRASVAPEGIRVGRPESQDRAGHGNWVCGVVLMMQVHENVRKAFQVCEADCSWSLISQRGHSCFW